MPAPIRDHRDLTVWQTAMDLAVICYDLADRLPMNDRFALAFQMRKAALSVPSNIAEGYGRRSPGDYARFLAIAASSLREIDTQLELIQRTNRLPAGDLVAAMDLSGQVGRMLTKLIGRLKP